MDNYILYLKNFKFNFIIYISILLCILKKNIDCQLMIIPPETTVIRSLGDDILWTCKLSILDQIGIIVNIQWINEQTGLEILDKTPGRDNLPFVDKSIPLMSKLYIQNILPFHEGKYKCVAFLSGNINEITVNLLIQKDITFENCPTEQYPQIYTNALIMCQVYGQPIPDVFWKYRGERLTGERYIQDVYGLRIKNISKKDEGLYSAFAEVEALSKFREREINIIVRVPPVINNFPDQEGIASQEFNFFCNATGLPDANFEFYKNDNEQLSFSTDRIQVDRLGGQIIFRPLIDEDRGRYQCRAFNDVGEDKKFAMLKVIVPPKIYAVRNVTQTEGLKTTLICLSYGNPPPIMSFQKAGNLQDYKMGENENGRIIMTNPGPGNLELTINPLRWDDTANYTCKSYVRNLYHWWNGTIIVFFVPKFSPFMPSVVYNWAGKTRNLTCLIFSKPLPVVEWLRFDRILTNNETFRIYIMQENSNLQVTIREYDQLFIYGNYTCRARNQLGQNEKLIEMKRSYLPGAPLKAEVIRSTPTTLQLDITPPSSEFLYGVQLLGFWVQHDNIVQDFYLSDPVLIEYLRPSNEYALLIRVRTEVGIGDTLSITAKTMEMSVPYPILINSNSYGEYPYEYVVTWMRPESGGFPIREYQFRMRKVAVVSGTFQLQKGLSEWTRRIQNTDISSPSMFYRIQGLLPNTYYQLEVTALNDIGWSLPNPEFIFKTADDIFFEGSYDDKSNSQLEISLILILFCIVVYIL